jgi:hypothetical protein
MWDMRGAMVALLLAIPSTARAERALVIDGVLGPAYLTESRSHAVSHLFKPLLRLDLRAEVAPWLEIGGGALALLTSSEHYRVVGGVGHARLAATARKKDGAWHWDEYTRNFPDEALRRNLAGQGICTGCHQHAREADWIFTQFSAP